MKQILIVEDDELLNKMLVYNLQSESYGNIICGNGKRSHGSIKKPTV